MPAKRGPGTRGNVRLMEGVIKEEGLVPMGGDEVDGFAQEDFGHLLILPQGGCAAAHMADAADAVHDGHVVAMARMQLEQVRMRPARWGRRGTVWRQS